ncbi:MAG: PD-(D/E)XK nuclease family protein [Candidatus Eremiobacteraeota bacterium]|nr:PD-(D/E)XK nuclease family protein [Candidatus Eremiobacteraeota bacterium]MBC5802732.1 PD-(D/E)XK nuclease family protein [Candidatus Eremiobacteraeota bacterium]MBC5821580.1 PD-(D/E)XK nuclease family protein [Candidatus Eremiobacteraeota bacterium]
MVESLPGELGAPALRLVAFVGDLLSIAVHGYAPQYKEDAARRALCAPYTGLPLADSRAIIAASGQRRAVAATIAADSVPLAHESAVAARRFARALDDLTRAYRAQGVTASEYLKTIALSFGLIEKLDERERRTFATLEALAAASDAKRLPGDAFNAEEFVSALEHGAKRTHRERSVPLERRPLAAREPEAARPVPRRKTHFSASSLGTFAECERRWYYRYVCAAVDDPGSSASFYGTAFHTALERFHEEFPRADAAPLDVLQRKLDGYLGTSFEHHRGDFETSVEFELQRRRALRTGQRYLTWFVERFRARPFTVIGRETAVELDLDGYDFIGFVDRLDRDDRTGNVTVVDYKTGTIPESAERYRDKVARLVDFQLPFYYFARTAAGDRVTRLALVPLKDAGRDVAPIELEVVPHAEHRSHSDATTGTIGLDELERARAKMTELAAALADAPLERFPPTDDPSACAYCTYANACRERPQRREDRFGH